MKLGITNVDGDFYKVVKVNKIEDLIHIVEKYDHPIILDKNMFYKDTYVDNIPQAFKDCEYSVEIYDNYRE